MTRPQFPRRWGWPVDPASYRAIARRLRRMADGIEARADYDRDDPHQLAGMTRRIAALLGYARQVLQRHQRAHG